VSSHPFVPLEFSEMAEDEMRLRGREFYERMRLRRSVRHFSDRSVPREIVEQAIRAAATAPSGAHKQPWHFVLVGDPTLKAAIRAAAEEVEREAYERRMPRPWVEDLEPLGTDWNKPHLTTCPWLIVVFAVQHARPDSAGIKRKHYYVQESVGIAVGMLLTGLHLSGLATLTHTPSPMDFLCRILDRPTGERPFLLVAVGYPEPGCRVPALSRKPLEEILTVR